MTDPIFCAACGSKLDAGLCAICEPKKQEHAKETQDAFRLGCFLLVVVPLFGCLISWLSFYSTPPGTRAQDRLNADAANKQWRIKNYGSRFIFKIVTSPPAAFTGVISATHPGQETSRHTIDGYGEGQFEVTRCKGVFVFAEASEKQARMKLYVIQDNKKIAFQSSTKFPAYVEWSGLAQPYVPPSNTSVEE